MGKWAVLSLLLVMLLAVAVIWALKSSGGAAEGFQAPARPAAIAVDLKELKRLGQPLLSGIYAIRTDEPQTRYMYTLKTFGLETTKYDFTKDWKDFGRYKWIVRLMTDNSYTIQGLYSKEWVTPGSNKLASGFSDNRARIQATLYSDGSYTFETRDRSGKWVPLNPSVKTWRMDLLKKL
jgi:hypothetical protein